MWLPALFMVNVVDAFTILIVALSLHDALPLSAVTGVPGSDSRACLSAWPMPRERSPPGKLAWMPTVIEPSERRTAGQAMGRMVASTTSTPRSEEHTSELQSRGHLVCRLLLEKKNG